MKTTVPFAIGITFAAAVLGCGGSGDSSSSTGSSATASTSTATTATSATSTATTATLVSGYQFVNLVEDSTQVWQVDSTDVASGIAYGGRFPGNNLQPVSGGNHNFAVSGTASGTDFSIGTGVETPVSYVFQFVTAGTAGASGSNSVRFSYVGDTRLSLNTSRANLRIYNALPNVSDVDVFVTSPDQSLDTVSPTASALAHYTFSPTVLSLTAGTYRVRVTGTGTKEPLLADQTLSFDADRYGFIAIMPNGSNVAVNTYASPF